MSIFKSNKEKFNFKYPGGYNKELNHLINYLEGKYEPLLSIIEESEDSYSTHESIDELCYNQPFLKDSPRMVLILERFRSNVLSIKNDRGEMDRFNVMLNENPSFYIHVLCKVLPSIAHFNHSERSWEKEREETPIEDDYFHFESSDDSLCYPDDHDDYLGAEIIDASSFLSIKDKEIKLPVIRSEFAISSIGLTISIQRAFTILFGPEKKLFIFNNIANCLVKALVDTSNAKVAGCVVPCNAYIEIKSSFVKWIGTGYLKQKNLPCLVPNVRKNRIERWDKLYYIKNGTLLTSKSYNRLSKPNKEVFKNQKFCNDIGYRIIPEKAKFMMDNIFSTIALKSKRTDPRFYSDERSFVTRKMRENVLTPSLKIKLEEKIKKSSGVKSIIEDEFYKEIFDKLGKTKTNRMIKYASKEYRIAMSNARTYLELYFLLLIFKDKTIYFTSFADFRLREYYSGWPLNIQATPIIRDLLIFNCAFKGDKKTIQLDAVNNCVQNSAMMGGDEHLLKIAKVIDDSDFLEDAYIRIVNAYKIRGFDLERKWAKNMLMCRMYGEGFTSRVRTLFNNSMSRRLWSIEDNAYKIPSGVHKTWCEEVANDLDEVIEEACPGLLNFILEVERLLDKRMVLIIKQREKRGTPKLDISGFDGWDKPIPKEYYLLNSKFGRCMQTNMYPLYTKQSITQFLGGKDKTVVKRYYFCQFKRELIGYIDSDLLRPDHDVMRRGAIPNTYHAVDAVIMNGVTRRFRLKGRPISKIHDCFHCMYDDAKFLQKCYRLEMRDLLTKPYMEDFLEYNFNYQSSNPLLNKSTEDIILRSRSFELTRLPLAEEVEDSLESLLNKGNYNIVE